MVRFSLVVWEWVLEWIGFSGEEESQWVAVLARMVDDLEFALAVEEFTVVLEMFFSFRVPLPGPVWSKFISRFTSTRSQSDDDSSRSATFASSAAAPGLEFASRLAADAFCPILKMPAKLGRRIGPFLRDRAALSAVTVPVDFDPNLELDLTLDFE
jgi:hypothetical protein